MYSTAATVSCELMTTFSFSSWMEPPKDQIIAEAAMLESISWDIPMPIWMPWSLLISRAALEQLVPGAWARRAGRPAPTGCSR